MRTLMKNNFRLDLAKEMDHSLGSIFGDDLMFCVANGKSDAEWINVLPKI